MEKRVFMVFPFFVPVAKVEAMPAMTDETAMEAAGQRRGGVIAAG
ncbi:hypothetical protein AB0M36_07150 [Actinoplanes sp. NPDC051346]